MFRLLVLAILAAIAGAGSVLAAPAPIFNITQVEVRAEQDRPQICIHLSAALERDAHRRYQDFLHVEPHADFSVSIEDHSLCVGNLDHGRVYRISLKRGLPSQSGARLPADRDIEAWIPDRQQRIVFQPGGYVLPANGPRQLVLRTVNIREVQIRILRVPPGGLNAELRRRWPRNSLQEGDVDRLAANLAEDVYRGVLIIPEGPNRAVETGLPLDDALANSPPGLYVAIAGRRGERQGFRPFAAQWFTLSDLGLVTFSGSDGLTIAVHSLSTGAALGGVDLNLIARDNRELGRAITAPDGLAHFDAAELGGSGGSAPSLLIASNGDMDFNFLDLETAPYDFSDRGVGGERAAEGINAFVAVPRSTYRPGSHIDAVALFRDDTGKASDGVSATLRLIRPDGAEYVSKTVKDEGHGAIHAAFDLPQSATPGIWRIDAQVEQHAAGSTRFTVVDEVPASVAVEIAAPESALPGSELGIDIRADYLSGGPASGLSVQGQARIVPSDRPPLAPPAYHFGPTRSSAPPPAAAIAPIVLDAKGRGRLLWHVNATDLQDRGTPRSVDIAVMVTDPNGRPVERHALVPLIAASFHLGLKPDFVDDRIPEQSSAAFDVIGVDGFGHQVAASNLRYELVAEEPDYVWHQAPSGWSYERILRDRPIGAGIFSTTPGQPTRLTTPALGHGRYRIDLSDPSGSTLTALRFVSGSWSDINEQSAPDRIQVGIEAGAHNSDQTLKVFLRPPYDAQILLAMADDHIRDIRSFNVPAAGAVVEMPMPNDIRGGLYVLATAFGDPRQLKGALAARAYGTAWVAGDIASRQFKVKLGLPQAARPGIPLSIPIALEGLGPNESADLVLAAVDETTASNWSPLEFFFGQRDLGLQTRDVFGDLIDTRGVPRGELRAGGELPRRTAATSTAVVENPVMAKSVTAPSPAPTAPAQPSVLRFLGPIHVPAGGATLTLDIPKKPIPLKLLALAWNDDKLGFAAAALPVSDVVDVGFDPPSALHLNDRLALRIPLGGPQAPKGEYHVSLKGDLGLGVEAGEATLPLAPEMPKIVSAILTATTIGRHDLELEISGPEGLVIKRHAIIDVAAPWPAAQRRQIALIPAGKSASVQPALRDLSGGLMPETIETALGLSATPPIDVPGLLRGLTAETAADPEALVDRLVPGLAPGDWLERLGLTKDPAFRGNLERLAQEISGLMSESGELRAADGSKADSDWLTAYAVDLLWRLREKSFSVPQPTIDRGITRLQLMTQPSDAPPSAAQAYALFVLARAHAAELSDLRLFDDQSGPSLPRLARAQLAAGLMLLGDPDRARWRFENPPVEAPDLRDRAGALALAAEFKILRSDELAIAADRLADDIVHAAILSPQEQAWSLMAAYQWMRRPGALALAIDGKPEAEGNLAPFRLLAGSEPAPMVENRGRQSAIRLLSIAGVPRDPPPALAEGLSVKRTLWTLDGKAATGATRGERLIVTLDIVRRGAPSAPLDLRLRDPLPAGLEIEGEDLRAMAMRWLGKLAEPDWLDRAPGAYAGFVHLDGTAREFRLAYLVRASRAGQFAWPGTIVADAVHAQFRARLSPGRLIIGDTDRR